MLQVFRLGARNDSSNPYGEKLGATKASPAGKIPFQKMGSVWIGFSFLAGNGSSEMRAAVGADSFSNLAKAMLDGQRGGGDPRLRRCSAVASGPDDPGVRPDPVRPAKAGRDGCCATAGRGVSPKKRR